MSDARDRVLDRTAHLLARYLLPARHGTPLPLEVAARTLHGEPVGHDAAVAGPWEPFAVGDRWGADWDTTWFRLRGTIPEEWSGGPVELLVDLGHHGEPGFGAEGQVWRDGEPLAGVNSRHREVVLADRAEPGRTIEVYVEAAANPPGGKETLLAPDYDGPPRLVLGRADLALRRVEVDELCIDLAVLMELAASLPVEDHRCGEVVASLREACAVLDPRAVEASAGAVRKVLAEPLAARGAPGAHRISAVGHAHIDTAWLWPLRETVRKCARTFSTALDLMDRHPGFRFACSQAQQHAWMQERYPSVFARMQARAAEGRFEPVGSMWVEPDCNVPSGESLVRQFLYGKRFFLDAYGVETRDCWLPDAFGYPASLPQIMVQAGVDRFVTQKLSWNSVNHFPHHTFRWEGIDGSSVLAHLPPSDTYNGDMSVGQLRYAAANFADDGVAGSSLYPFGYGDGGGGPTREMLQRAERVADLDGVPRVGLDSVADFLDRLGGARPGLATWAGELYLELHRGTYTTHGEVKAANRRAETALRDAELWSAGLAELRDGYPGHELAQAWKTLLVHQFHDILPGSSINWVYRDTATDHAAVLAVATAVSARADAVLAAGVDPGTSTAPYVVLNPSSFERDEPVALVPGDVAAGAGVQRAEDGALLARAQVPSCGWATVDAAGSGGGPAVPVTVAGRVLDNGIVRVELDGDGCLRSVRDERVGREVLAAGQRGNVLQLLDDEPAHWDAWDVDEFADDRSEELTGVESIEVVEAGPLRAAIRVRRRFGSSTLTQTVRLRSGSARIDFVTEVDWHERHRLLKVAFPVAVRSADATYEIQFGSVRRPTHANTSWDAARFEVCGHRWADLSEPGYGVALLNDAKYGYDVRGDRLRLSLLRSPTAPDPEADQGRHSFTYSLFPHPGDHVAGRVVEEGLALNQPMRAVRASGPAGGRPAAGSLVAFDRPGVVLEALKRAEDGPDLVLRCYEAHGGRGPVRVRVGFAVAVAHRADLLERPGDPVEVTAAGDGAVIDLDVRPFEIVTLLLRLPV